MTKTRNIKKQTAAQAYAEARKDIDTLLAKIKDGLDAHQAEHGGQPRNWGFVGDMNGYKEKFQEISDQLYQEGEYADDADGFYNDGSPR